MGGNSYTGDKLLARLNSGERIITKKQNDNFEDLLDGKFSFSGYTHQSVEVVGKIKGTDIVLVQENVAKIMKKNGKSISFG